MKHKYTAAIALMTWLLVTGWLTSMVIAKPAVLRRGGNADETAAMAELRQGIGRNEKVLAGLQRFDDLPTTTAEPAALVALAPPASAAPAAGDTGADAVAEHRVSLIVSHGNRRRALVSGRYLGPGARLDDGTRVLAIGADWVRLDDPVNGQRTIRVRGAFEPPAAADGAVR